MDGARFANAVVALELTPAEMTWKRGVDIVSFGATKNGCWCAEALVFMNPELSKDLPFIRKRAAQKPTRYFACWIKHTRINSRKKAPFFISGIRHAQNLTC